MKSAAEEAGVGFAILSGIQKIKLSGAEKRAFARWARVYGESAEMAYNPPMLLKMQSALVLAVPLLGTVWLYYKAVRSGVSPSAYLAFFAAYGALTGAFTAFANLATQAAQIVPILELAEPILTTEPEISEGKESITRLSGGIELSNVTFRYSENSPYMIAKIIYSDTTTAEYQYVSFNDDVGEWQYACGTIVPKREDKTIASITVYLASDLNPNTAYIDEVSLVQEPVQTYSYDDNGNLLVATNSEGKTSTEYDSSERLKKYTTMSGVVYNLTYSGTSRDVQKITSDGVQTTYTYNAAGEVTQTQTKPTSGNLYLQSSAEYSTDKNFKTSATDVNGSVTKASYNAAKGLVTDTTAANNTKTFYVYNANNDRQTMSYISDVAATHYSYNENGLLSRLARKGFYGTSTLWQAYDFHYNEWGQTFDISVRRTDTADGTGYSDGLTLAQYDYADHGGNLIKMTYGNGQFVTYEYDLFDRLVHTVYYTSSNTVQAEYYYVYNSEGALAKQYAVSGGSVTEEYNFEYDSLDRLIRSREMGAGDAVTQRTEHLYDEANRLTKQAWTLGADSFTETYTYNSGDGSLNTVTTAQIGSVANSYDSLKRLTELIFATKTGVNYGRWYTYADSGNDASSLVSSFAYRSGSTSTGRCSQAAATATTPTARSARSPTFRQARRSHIPTTFRGS